MTPLEAVILAMIQGITEWLPISSSGHLVILQELWGLDAPLFFDVALHLGTATAAMTYFRREIMRIFRALGRVQFRSEDAQLGVSIVIGMIPTAAIGLAFHDALVQLFTQLLAVGIALLVTGALLYATRLERRSSNLSIVNSILIGTAQGISIIPGISRSGATIATGILRGIDRVKVSTYSFLLSIPAVLGAAVLELRGIDLSLFQLETTLAGAVVSALVGYVFIGVMMRLVANQKLHNFAYYCWAAGALTVLLSLLRGVQ